MVRARRIPQLIALAVCLVALCVPLLPDRAAARQQEEAGARASDAGAAVAAPVIDGPVFNDPTALAADGPSARQAAVMDQLIGLIQATPAGERINFVMFEFAEGDRSTDVLNALLDAHSRGVHVQVVLDSSSKDVLAKLKAAFDAGTDRDSWAVACPAGRGCIGRNYLHSKFALFSKLVVDGQEHRDVVFQTSSNLTDWYLYNAYNDAFTFTDANVYADYLKYFGDLRAMKLNPDYFWTSQTGSTYRALFYPRRSTEAKDPIANTLKLVKCSYQDEGGVTRQTDIRLVMTKFNKNRPAVAKQLRALRDQGCWVDLVYPADNEDGVQSVDKETLATLKGSGGQQPVQVTPCRFDPGNGEKVTIHNKVMMIDGAYDDDIVPRVYTGSANFTHLENSDDSTVRVMGRATHTTYLSWFHNVRDTCKAGG